MRRNSRSILIDCFSLNFFGWRRSADRASLYVKSLLSGNFKGKNTISGFLGPISWQEAAVPHQFLA
jgi:hypothetical protein